MQLDRIEHVCLRPAAKSWRLFLVACFVLSVSLPSARASTFVPAVPVDLPYDPMLPLSLRAAFTLASINDQDDTIILIPGLTYLLSSCDEGAVTHTDDKHLTIVGNGATIHQTCVGKGILASTAPFVQVTIRDVHFVGAGGIGLATGIDSLSKLSMTGSSVSGVNGVGIHSQAPMLLVDSNVFENEDIGISCSSATIKGSRITANGRHGINGSDGALMEIIDSVITNNGEAGVRDTGQGHSQVRVRSSTVAGNGGAGVCCAACQSIDVDDSEVSGNGTNAAAAAFVAFEICLTGGGVALSIQYSGAHTNAGLRITDSNVAGNLSVHPGGGAFAFNVSQFSFEANSAILRSNIIDNTTVGETGNGGGLAVDIGSLQVVDSTFAGNRAGVGALVSPANGGGLWYRPKSDATPLNFLSIEGTRFVSNDASAAGGGFEAELTEFDTLDLSRLDLIDNTAQTTGGGATLCTQSGVLSDSFFGGNHAARGGGLYTCPNGPGSALTVERATFARNSAETVGNGISAFRNELTLVNSTISNNFGAPRGGLAVELADATIDFSTLLENAGQNVWAVTAGVFTHASVVASALGGPSCAGSGASFTSVGFNFFSDPSCGSIGTDTISNADPLLGALANNGGAAPTRLPAPASPVRNLVPVGSCNVSTDQRLMVRPQGAACEAGSVEVP